MRAAFALALRTLGREARSGDLAVLFLALFVAVAALTGVGFLVGRVDRAMHLQASEVLGADLRLQSGQPIGAGYAAEAARRGIDTARLTSMLSVILKGDRTQLAEVNAVSPGYPLRGEVQVAAEAFGAPASMRGIPAAGEVWPDSRLLAALGAHVGDTISVGSADLRVARVLISRPDQGSGFVDLAPSLLMNEADLPATQLIQPGSRVSYAALFAGSRAAIGQFAPWLAHTRQPGERLRDIAEASSEVGNAATRAGHFLSLAGLTGVLLCAVAIAMTARRYVKRHLDLAALLKTLGATHGTVLGISLLQLTCIALIAAAAGVLAGFMAQQGLLALLQGMIAAQLPPPDWHPALMGFVAALLLLAGCALPPLLQLARVPALRVLRRDIGPPPLAALLAYGPAALAIALLIRWMSGDTWLAVAFIVGLAAAMGVLALAGWLLVSLVGRLRRGPGIAWRYGAANLARRRGESILQIVALGLGLAALLLLTIVRGDLIQDWQARLPANPPNYFFVNIPGGQRDAFRDLLAGQGAQLSRLLPMIRGRLLAINGAPVAGRGFSSARGEGFAMREQNLSWSDDIGTGNKIVAGHWFRPQEHGQPLVSVATDFAESLGLKLGDQLTFDVAGESVQVSISSFRDVQWDSLQPNFFLMFAPGLLDGLAGTWMASAVYRPDNSARIAELVRRFPGVSIFDVGQLVAQVRSIFDKAVLAVQSVFLFTLLAGIVVLLAAVQATREERRYESAMLRTLGASRRLVLAGVLLEFALLGMAAGVIAAAAAACAGGLIATRLLDIPYRADPALWITGGLAGAGLVCIAGWLATRTALHAPPMQILRQD
ncbi:MAG TPA: FtsX-like permease family protein [Steroidobacteraceae bacterium]|nr:FtsX-like permease family protein [Steroidobacteraceae bacterium]